MCGSCKVVKRMSSIEAVQYIHLSKSKAYSLKTTPSSRQRGCYIRTITARVQLEKISGRGSQGA
jgi:ACT domain-containing protein